MRPIHLAFLWHQHQPLYKDLARHRYILPWVRLHAIKDYIGMPLVLKEFPKMRATINMVPSLVMQIEDYAEGEAEDDALRITRLRAEDLAESDRMYMMEFFFVGNMSQIIQPNARYRELHEKRTTAYHNLRQTRLAFSTNDFRDLQVWATLAWFHPLIVESNPTLRELRRKGRDFTEADKTAMLSCQDEVIRKVLPLHRELLEAGQIEISTTPLYHPILPLLCNMESAWEAMPGLPMPRHRTDFSLDAQVHVERAIEFHERIFGRKPTGLWPAEGSVSMDIIPLLSNHGIRWIATDEQILSRSTTVNLCRDGNGNLCAPDDLYQPYRLPGDGAPAIVFRDRVLSDAIGFSYHHGDNRANAARLVQRILDSADRCQDRSHLISIMLDGENPWDYYDDAGLPFLRELYTRLSAEDRIVTTRLADYIEEHPPERNLMRLAAGSWIDANFAIWVGSEEDREAWSLLAEARDAVMRRISQQPPLRPEAKARALEEILIAEGSDWCWWFGNDHSSEQDYMFDALFRAHLANAYHFIGEEVPVNLLTPIGKPVRPATHVTPVGTLRVTFDGKQTDEKEWSAAGYLTAASSSAAIRRATSDLIRDIHYGFSADSFFVRLDPYRPFAEVPCADAQFVLRFVKPEPRHLVVASPLAKKAVAQLFDATGNKVGETSMIAIDEIIEIGCPLKLVAPQPINEIEFLIEINRGDELVQRIPPDGTIRAPLSQT